MQGTIERGIYGAHTKILDIQNNFKAVIYQDTAVVKFNDEKIILTAPESAKTQTTKLRMNQASYQYNLGYIVVQKQGKWYVYTSKISDSGKLTKDILKGAFETHKFKIYR